MSKRPKSGRGRDRLQKQFRPDDAVLRKLRDTLAKVDVEEVQAQLDRIEAAKALPEDDHRKMIWLRFLHVTPAFLTPIWRYLPDPLSKRGRPRGTSKVGPLILQEMDRRVSKGERPTAAAKAIVGDVAGAKNAADHIVKVWKARRGK